jgi:hypothetical protein
MQLIKPKQISGEIMTLIEEADKKMIFVSPYYNITKWDKLLNPLEKLKKRKIEVEFFVREGEAKSISEVREVGFNAIPIKNLHTKLYLNEKEAIISSMNLNSSSDNHSLDIALKTENKEEYDEVVEYYERYIKRETLLQPTKVATTYPDWREELERRLEGKLKRNVNVRSYNGYIKIFTSNQYRVSIENESGLLLKVSGILSYKEFQFLYSNRNEFRGSTMDIEMIKGNDNHYNSIWGTLNGFRSRHIESVYKNEEEKLIDTVFDFITRVEEVKRKVT